MKTKRKHREFNEPILANRIFNSMHITSLFSIIICSFFGIAYASHNIPENKEPAHSNKELQTQLENVLKDMHVPGMSVAIVHRDGSTWTVGLGKADVANSHPATVAILFRIGSISKGFISLIS